MESWSYEAQEKGRKYSDLKVEYKDLCNSIIDQLVDFQVPPY